MVVDATEFSSSFPADSVLVLGERDETVSIQKYNFWLAQSNKTLGQGFTIKVDECKRLIAGCQIKNRGIGISNWGTKEFRLSGSLNRNGPWQILLEEELEDTTNNQYPNIQNFSFTEPVEVQFLKFDLVSFWGQGGALQYFAAIPAESK